MENQAVLERTEVCTCAETASSGCGNAGAGSQSVSNDLNTLQYDAGLCINCGMCATVCPHGVFTAGDGDDVAQLVCWEACMESGACELNCPTGAITVDSGVGCAAAMIAAALTGKEPTCGTSDEEGCCCG